MKEIAARVIGRYNDHSPRREVRSEKAAHAAPACDAVTVQDHREHAVGNGGVASCSIRDGGCDVGREECPNHRVSEVVRVVGFGARAALDRGVPDLDLHTIGHGGRGDSHPIAADLRVCVRNSRINHGRRGGRRRCDGWINAVRGSGRWLICIETTTRA